MKGLKYAGAWFITWVWWYAIVFIEIRKDAPPGPSGTAGFTRAQSFHRARHQQAFFGCAMFLCVWNFALILREGVKITTLISTEFCSSRVSPVLFGGSEKQFGGKHSRNENLDTDLEIRV
jgi:hypothetical protein